MIDDITIYEPNQRAKMGLFATWWTLAMNIVESRDLIWQLFCRDFFAAYKKSFFGLAWILFAPVMGMISWVFFNMTGVLRPGDVGIPYPAYVLLGSTIFGLWVNFATAASGTLSAGMGFINQVHYHHDALLIKQAAVQLANFLITFVLCVVILLCFGVVPSPMTLLLPVFLLPIFFLGSAIGLLVAPASSVSGDVSRAVSFMLGLVMYVTPIVYSSKVESKLLQAITAWNPLTYLVGGCRDAIVYGRIEHLGMYALMAVLSFVLFLLSWRIFYVTEMRVIEKMI